jgi:hypothetical protein
MHLVRFSLSRSTAGLIWPPQYPAQTVLSWAPQCRTTATDRGRTTATDWRTTATDRGPHHGDGPAHHGDGPAHHGDGPGSHHGDGPGPHHGAEPARHGDGPGPHHGDGPARHGDGPGPRRSIANWVGLCASMRRGTARHMRWSRGSPRGSTSIGPLPRRCTALRTSLPCGSASTGMMRAKPLALGKAKTRHAFDVVGLRKHVVAFD